MLQYGGYVIVKHWFSLVPFGHVMTKVKMISPASCNHVITAL